MARTNDNSKSFRPIGGEDDHNPYDYHPDDRDQEEENRVHEAYEALTLKLDEHKGDPLPVAIYFREQSEENYIKAPLVQEIIMKLAESNSDVAQVQAFRMLSNVSGIVREDKEGDKAKTFPEIMAYALEKLPEDKLKTLGEVMANMCMEAPTRKEQNKRVQGVKTFVEGFKSRFLMDNLGIVMGNWVDHLEKLGFKEANIGDIRPDSPNSTGTQYDEVTDHHLSSLDSGGDSRRSSSGSSRSTSPANLGNLSPYTVASEGSGKEPVGKAAKLEK